jgi:DNA polymerase-3 subunit gamma/tau
MSETQENQVKLGRWTDMYQRYRPFQLKAVVGQEKVVKSLSNSAKRNSFNHAYLLAGSYGSGKTSFARILASLIACPNRKPGSDVVCGKCKYCIGIHEGHCVDVMEFDGADQTGVDDARDLKKSASFSPQELKQKIYIIDECHRLSQAANSALLKILEEPPPFVHFIFCTTDANKVLPTIISRCQRHVLTKIPSKLMTERLELVAKMEGIKVEPGATQYIARLSDGSLRDAFGNLEQVAIYSEGNITNAVVADFFGLPEKRITYEIVHFLATNNLSAMMGRINDLVMASVMPREILFEVSNIFRNIFVLKCCGKNAQLLDINDDELATIEALSQNLSMTVLTKIAGSLAEVEKRVAVNINERWIVEAALVHCASIINAEAIKSVKS